MADISLTPGLVVAADNAVKESGLAGETIAAGKAVYKAASKKWMLADNNSATAGAKVAGGIALNGASLNQPLTVIKSGDLNMGGAVLTAGATYFLSDTAGGICPDADVGAGENVCQLGVAKTTSVLAVRISAPGVTR